VRRRARAGPLDGRAAALDERGTDGGLEATGRPRAWRHAASPGTVADHASRDERYGVLDGT